MPYVGAFDGYRAVVSSVTRTCLIHFDRNRYSVPARVAGRPVEVQAYAERIVVRQDGEIATEHSRCFGRGQTIYDPWHYVPVLNRKPGALRNGAPFRNWTLPRSLTRLRRRLDRVEDGDRQMVDVLNAVLVDGLAGVENACNEALAAGTVSSDVILNILARRKAPTPTPNVLTPRALAVREQPLADCARYDTLRGTHGTL